MLKLLHKLILIPFITFVSLKISIMIHILAKYSTININSIYTFVCEMLFIPNPNGSTLRSAAHIQRASEKILSHVLLRRTKEIWVSQQTRKNMNT